MHFCMTHQGDTLSALPESAIIILKNYERHVVQVNFSNILSLIGMITFLFNYGMVQTFR